MDIVSPKIQAGIAEYLELVDLHGRILTRKRPNFVLKTKFYSKAASLDSERG